MNIFKVLWTFCQIASLGLLSWKCMMKDESHSWGQAGPGQKRKSIPSILAERDIPESPSRSLVIRCPDTKASLVALPFLESQFGVLPYMDGGAADALVSVFVRLPRAPTLGHRAFAFAVPLSRKCFPLQFVVTGALTVCFSVQMPNVQRGHLQRSDVKKPDTLCCQHFYQVDFIHSLYYSCLVSMFNSVCGMIEWSHPLSMQSRNIFWLPL